jgi:hypothetical protein
MHPPSPSPSPSPTHTHTYTTPRTHPHTHPPTPTHPHPHTHTHPHPPPHPNPSTYTHAQQLFMHPIGTYALPQTFYANYSSAYRQTWSALSENMPLNVHLLTFDQLNPKQFLIRVEHYFELNEDETYSQPVKVDLQAFFKSLGTITDLIELTLGANLPSFQLHRLDWITNNKESLHINLPSEFYFDQ